jgi:branched-chain amino acid transport system permease protein
MIEIFGISSQALFGQLLIGLINGAFYAMLSLGLAVIFGMLNIINFCHGALYMIGAFVAWMLLNWLGIGYWWALLISPIVTGALGVVIERLFLQRLRDLDTARIEKRSQARSTSLKRLTHGQANDARSESKHL